MNNKHSRLMLWICLGLGVILLGLVLALLLIRPETPPASGNTSQTDTVAVFAPSGGNTTEEIVNVKLLADAIGIYLRTQSAEARNAFIGRYYFLDSLREVSAYLGISESKCKTLLYRTRLGLKAYLEKEGFCL